MELELEKAQQEEAYQKLLREIEEQQKQQLHELEVQHEYGTAKMAQHINELELKNLTTEKRLRETSQQVNITFCKTKYFFFVL